MELMRLKLEIMNNIAILNNGFYKTQRKETKLLKKHLDKRISSLTTCLELIV